MDRKVIGRLGDEKGVTLIELMVVCVILGIAFIGLLTIFPLGTKNLNESKMRTVATDLAQEKAEELITMTANNGDLSPGTHNDPNNPVRTTFNRFWSITDDTPVSKMKKIEVWVTYPRGAATREVRVVTYRRG